MFSLAIQYCRFDGPERVLSLLDQILRQDEWLAGPQFSTADIAWMSNLRRMELMRFPPARFPALTEWLERVKLRPSYRKALQGYEPVWLGYDMRAYTGLRASAGLPFLRFFPKRRDDPSPIT